mmetsp:Transcript_7197/g.23637  ORF Transcript_7197/g.23637 Transcript_7197/m.23637 type:complete len:224 (-) Transcript_7197:304-975(-)
MSQAGTSASRAVVPVSCEWSRRNGTAFCLVLAAPRAHSKSSQERKLVRSSDRKARARRLEESAVFASFQSSTYVAAAARFELRARRRVFGEAPTSSAADRGPQDNGTSKDGGRASTYGLMFFFFEGLVREPQREGRRWIRPFEAAPVEEARHDVLSVSFLLLLRRQRAAREHGAKGNGKDRLAGADAFVGGDDAALAVAPALEPRVRMPGPADAADPLPEVRP